MRRALLRLFVRAFAASAVVAAAAPLGAKQLPPPLSLNEDGHIHYVAESNGDRVPDYSHAGYRGGGVPLPDVPACLFVSPIAGDNGDYLQMAIDKVSAREPDANGFRGAILLAPGRYEIAGQLKIQASGVVLRGSGSGEDGTVLVATGTDRRALIEVSGMADRKSLGPKVNVIDDYVPVGANRLRVSDAAGLKVGMSVTIERPSPEAWIAEVGMNDSPGRQPYRWKANCFNVRWDRVLTAVDGDAITLDAPLTVSLEKRFGGGTVSPYSAGGYLEDVGVENLRCESTFDPANPLDEQHAWNAIDLHAVRNGWVAGVTGVHFAGTVVQLGSVTQWITVQDCAALAPVSEMGGYRRMAFHNRGQQSLFLRCFSEYGRNDFSVGYLAAGPNVFLECATRETEGFSGSIGSWASGLLMDRVLIDGGYLRLDNLETWNQGVGWNAANSMLWQSSAGVIVSRMPPGAHNWAVAVWGQFVGDGRWSMVNEFAHPDSLYIAQLQDRLGAAAAKALEPRKFDVSPRGLATFTPPPEGASPMRRGSSGDEPSDQSLVLANGWLTARGERLMVGRQGGVAWWLGRLEPARAKEFGRAITRFAPGRAGTGLTDEIPSVIRDMVASNEVALRQHYGLWHERRRIDHEMIRRPDADVYPPFYEMPFLRSGQGKAWDGLSRYDLTRYNPWYFGRLQQFAARGRENGRVLISEMYFQHNIIESGAHWVDCPWRPVNCLQDTGFTEPPPFNGDTIKMADAFYDVTHPVRRELHRAYIRQCLANLADEPNAIHSLSEEFTGPLHFVQFWLDVIGEWEAETRKHPLISLSATKDVQDAILADPKRAAVVDVIDLKYWYRTERGEEFAPLGGMSLAPRQHQRLWKGGRPSAASLAGMVSEYRTRFPDKAVITNWSEAEGWSCAAAGGSFPNLPASTDAALLAALPKMRPLAASGEDAWILAEPGQQLFACSLRRDTIELDLGGWSGTYVVREVESYTGTVRDTGKTVTGGGKVKLDGSGGGPAIFWLVRKP